jgi:hypothetical protein
VRKQGGPLSAADRFLVRVGNLDGYVVRVELLLLEKEFGAAAARLANEVELLDSVLATLIGSSALPTVLDLLLEVGNFFNTGSDGGGAVGFTLQSLLNVADTKSSDGTLTLLDHMASVVLTGMPEVAEEVAAVAVLLERAETARADVTTAIAETAVLSGRVSTLKATVIGGSLSFAKPFAGFFARSMDTTKGLCDGAARLGIKRDRLCEMYVETDISALLNHVRAFFGRLSASILRIEREAIAAAAATAAPASDELGAGRRSGEQRRTMSRSSSLSKAPQSVPSVPADRSSRRSSVFSAGGSGDTANNNRSRSSSMGGTARISRSRSSSMGGTDNHRRLSSSGSIGSTDSSSSRSSGSGSPTPKFGPNGSRLVRGGSWEVDTTTGLLQHLEVGMAASEQHQFMRSGSVERKSDRRRSTARGVTRSRRQTLSRPPRPLSNHSSL